MPQRRLKLRKLLLKKTKSKRVGYFIVALAVFFSVLSYDIIFRPASKVQAATTIGTSSSTTSQSDTGARHVVTTSNNTIVAFYNHGSLTTTGLVYSTSTDNGATWSALVSVDTTQTDDYSVNIDGADNIYVVFGTASSSPRSVKFRKLTYSAGTWTVGSAVTVMTGISCVTGKNPVQGEDYMNPSVAIAASGKIWISANHRSYDPAAACSTLSTSFNLSNSTNGTTWSSAAVGTDDAVHDNPTVAVGEDIWVFSARADLLWHYSAGSATWTSISTGFSDYDFYTSMAYGFDELHLMYRDSSTLDLMYVKFSLSLQTFSTPVTIATNTVGFEGGQVTTDSYNVWAFFSTYNSPNYDVSYKKFNGSTWDTNATNIVANSQWNVGIKVPERINNSSNVPFTYQQGSANPVTILGGSLSGLGTATDSGTTSGSLTGSLTGSSGNIIVKSGIWYYNSVNIVSGMTVKVLASNGQTGGSLEIHSNTITVAGTVDGSGRGSIGPAGPAGVGGAVSFNTGLAGSSSAGTAGSGTFGGSAGSAGTSATGGAAAGVSGSGGTGGSGGSGATVSGGSGGNGGYATSAGNGDSSIDETLSMGSSGGSGGSGGSGASGGIGGSGTCGVGYTGGASGASGAGADGGTGGKGGNGGAIIKLYSSGNVSVTGSIIATGQAAGSAGAGKTGSGGGAGGNATSAPSC